METTKDGFTFKRKTANKPMERSAVKQLNKTVVADDFVFRTVVKKNLGKMKKQKEILENKHKKSADSDELKFDKVDNKKSNKRYSKIINKDVIEGTVLENNNGEKCKSVRKIKKNANKLDDKNVEEINNNREIIEMDKSQDISTEETIRMEIPRPKERIKSNEIFKRVKTNGVNELIVKSIEFLKTGSKYSEEVIKNCKSNYFRDIDYRREIEQTNSKNEGIKDEIAKWAMVYGEEKESNWIADEQMNFEEPSEEEVGEKIEQEFEEKAKRLKGLEEKVSYFLEISKAKSENILRNIFDSIDEKKVNGMFLLKVMSRLGK